MGEPSCDIMKTAADGLHERALCTTVLQLLVLFMLLEDLVR
jgi:hypothetical protein